jgi:hypothetical protein
VRALLVAKDYASDASFGRALTRFWLNWKTPFSMALRATLRTTVQGFYKQRPMTRQGQHTVSE